MFTKKFWKNTALRAVKTFAQGVLGTIGATVIGLGDVDWKFALSAGALAAVISVLNSVIAIPDPTTTLTANAATIANAAAKQAAAATTVQLTQPTASSTSNPTPSLTLSDQITAAAADAATTTASTTTPTA